MADRRSPAATKRPAAVETFEAQTLRECALAAGQWLTDSGHDLNRPIHRLRLDELRGMVWAAIAKYTDAREFERKRFNVPLDVFPGEPDKLDDLGFVIRGDQSGTS